MAKKSAKSEKVSTHKKKAAKATKKHAKEKVKDKGAKAKKLAKPAAKKDPVVKAKKVAKLAAKKVEAAPPGVVIPSADDFQFERPERTPDVKPGTYPDGHPLDNVHYLECKVILKPEDFTSAESFHAFGREFRKLTTDWGIRYSTAHLVGQMPQIKEVIFLDTVDFRLYNNAYILRRRVTYEYGFPVGDPEIVFKFRHPDIQLCAEKDVRPHIPGIYRIKFKAEALPLRDKLGGYRKLFSHNVQFGLSQVEPGERTSLSFLTKVFPCLAPLKTSDSDRVELVNQTIVEEVLFDLGVLDFGKGVLAKTNIAIWRRRGDHKPLVAEFAFQAKFDRREELQAKILERCEKLFLGVQKMFAARVFLGATKTGVVYRLNGNPPQNHE
jgi:hypothetical protein